MNTSYDIMGLLHDTCLKDINLANNNLQLLFSFYLTDEKEYIVEVNSENISDISCVEYLRNNQTQILDIINTKGSDCIKAEQDKNNIEILFENIEHDTIIQMNYKSQATLIKGNIDQLKAFWDI